MAIDWSGEERTIVEEGIAKHGLRSGRCAALARIVLGVAKPRDAHARGVRLQPEPGALWLVPKDAEMIPYWGSHVYVETRSHAVDAITGPDGHAADRFVWDHWEFTDRLRISDVDPTTVDVGIQSLDDE